MSNLYEMAHEDKLIPWIGFNPKYSNSIGNCLMESYTSCNLIYNILLSKLSEFKNSKQTDGLPCL